MSAAQTAALVVIGIIAWGGLAMCVAVAIGLTIREADRRESAGEPEPPAERVDVFL